jgi:isopenicillin N synthase-like dioxygenase
MTVIRNQETKMAAQFARSISMIPRAHTRRMSSIPPGGARRPAIPRIDVAPLAAPTAHTDAERRACERAIADACATVGFFYATGHAVDAGVQARALGAAARFFALPAERKAALDNRRSYCFRGYVAHGLENTAGVADEREQIEFGSEEAALSAEARRAARPHYERLRGPNQWPDERELPGFRAAVDACVAELRALSELVAAALARRLGLRLEAHFARPHLQWKVCSYPPLAARALGAESGVGAHSDSGFLTLLVQSAESAASGGGGGGLQVLTDDGEWLAVPHVSGSVVVNCGEMLQLASDGRVRATVHRVLRAERGRLSLPFFYNPSLDARLAADDDASPSGGSGGATAARQSRTHGGANVLNACFGENALKSLARSHPEVLRRHHPDLL